MTILDAVRDPELFARWFAGETWAAWCAFLAAVFGLEMTEAELAVYRRHTARALAPTVPAREAWLVAGRRAGKSRVAAAIAVYLACFRSYAEVLAPGEVGTLMVLAADRRQARTVLRYVVGLLEGVPMLRRQIVRRSAEAIELKNRIVIEVHTSNFGAVRGYTLVGAVCDEVAFWRSEESANPDVEILAALRPGMATVPGAMLVALSTPYARRGALWETHHRHYGDEGADVLVWRAPTRAMNPTISEALLARAYAEDPASAAAEYGAEFRTDVEGLLAREAIEGATRSGRRELAPRAGLPYVAFVDPSGGSSDAMTLAVAHEEGGRAVLDALRECRPPFSPEAVVAEFAATLRAYGLRRVTGDRYAGAWVRERFAAAGVEFSPAPSTKSELYLELVPALNSGRVELLDDVRLAAQLAALERRTTSAGRETVDHPPRGHDDLANAAAGALVLALRRARRPVTAFRVDRGGFRPSLWRV